MNIRLRRRHRVTWYAMLLLLPLALGLAYTVRPGIEEVSVTEDVPCDDLLRSSSGADYYICDGSLLVRLKPSLRLPSAAVSLIWENGNTETIAFGNSTVIGVPISSGMSGSLSEIQLVDVLRGDVVDQFKPGQ